LKNFKRAQLLIATSRTPSRAPPPIYVPSQGRAQAFAAENGYRYAVHSPTLKKFAAGSGRAEKGHDAKAKELALSPVTIMKRTQSIYCGTPLKSLAVNNL
jgi:alkanesulfonate monooxygenase SsuD/methylene tetrahydromethanopterin reductase-like flavin-dependent oxidoreductase (luciferase family)